MTMNEAKSKKPSKLCQLLTELDTKDVAKLRACAEELPLMAELVDGEVFIDCVCTDGSVICIAAAHPEGKPSIYSDLEPVGYEVDQVDEPGVFMVLHDGKHYTNQLGWTPTGIPIRQDIVPIKNDERIIGALIKEVDCTSSVLRSKKYESMVRSNVILREALAVDSASSVPPVSAQSKYLSIQLNEANHRIKNSLQTIASIMRMDARRTDSPELKQKLLENASRILTVATIHDMLTANVGVSILNIREVLGKLAAEICSYASGDCKILCEVFGDECYIEYDKAVAVSLAVNELIINAFKYAFIGRAIGHITVCIKSTTNYKKVSVTIRYTKLRKFKKR
jgi:two-component sensor histidine kinase